MYIIISGDPIYKGPPTQQRIKEIQETYIWDEYNEWGFGVGQIIDSRTLQPIK